MILFVPKEFVSVIFLGTANTSLSFSSAYFAVISAPLFSGASVTSIPRDSHAIILFLAGK